MGVFSVSEFVKFEDGPLKGNSAQKKYFTQNNIQFEQNIGLFIDYSGTGHFLNYNKSSKVNETFSILIGQFFLDQSKSRLNPNKKQNRTRDLTSFTAFSRLSRHPPVVT